jgi:hypothetical protein
LFSGYFKGWGIGCASGCYQDFPKDVFCLTLLDKRTTSAFVAGLMGSEIRFEEFFNQQFS